MRLFYRRLFVGDYSQEDIPQEDIPQEDVLQEVQLASCWPAGIGSVRLRRTPAGGPGTVGHSFAAVISTPERFSASFLKQLG